MGDRIIRDIRFYEKKPENYTGQYDGTLGNVFKNTPDTKHIGERIARKLNELDFISGVFDHLYLYLSPTLSDNAIEIQKTEYDIRLKSVHYGIQPLDFNSLSEFNKDKWIKEAAFNVLYFLFRADNIKTKKIIEVETLIEKYNQEIEIYFKTKDTKAYKVDLSYQIKPNLKPSCILIKYFDKKTNAKKQGSINLNSYEDIYSLVDNVTVKNNLIVLNPKKSHITELLGDKFYKLPLTLELSELKDEY